MKLGHEVHKPESPSDPSPRGRLKPWCTHSYSTTPFAFSCSPRGWRMLPETSKPAFRHQNTWACAAASLQPSFQQEEESFQHVLTSAKALQGQKGCGTQGLRGSRHAPAPTKRSSLSLSRGRAREEAVNSGAVWTNHSRAITHLPRMTDEPGRLLGNLENKQEALFPLTRN